MKRISLILTLVYSLVVSNIFVITVSSSDISAKAAVVIDADTGEILYSKNKDDKLPMASTTKIMSTILSIESGDLDSYFTVSSDAIKVEGSSMGLKSGDKVTKRILCYGMMLPSGNDAANATAYKLSGSIENFSKLMNKKAKEIGLNNTNFVTPSGLDDYTDEHFSTAYDMAKLTAYAMKNEHFREICSQKSVKLIYGNPPYERWIQNTNKLLSNCDGVIGVKTGFTDKAKRCLISACMRNGRTLIVVTLNDPNDWLDHSNLYDECFKNYKSTLLKSDENIFRVSIAGSRDNYVTAYSNGEIKYFISDNDKIKKRILINPINYAPIKKDEKVGEIQFYNKDVLIGKLNIKSTKDVLYYVPEKNTFDKIIDFFKRLLY